MFEYYGSEADGNSLHPSLFIELSNVDQPAAVLLLEFLITPHLSYTQRMPAQFQCYDVFLDVKSKPPKNNQTE